MTSDQQPAQHTTPLTQRLDVDFALGAAGLGVWEYDPVSNQVLWDERCRALFGFAADNPMSYEQAFTYVHPQDAARVDQAAQWVMNPQSSGVFDQTYRTIGVDDGQLRWVRFQGKVYFTPTGGVARFGGVAQEVTGQVLAQQALEQTQQLLLRQFEQALVGIATISGEALIFQSANPFYGQLVGRSPQQIVGKPLLEALPELQGQGFDDLLKQVMTTGEPFVAQEVAVDLVRRGKRETIYVDLAYQPQAPLSGQLMDILVIATDVTSQVLSRQTIEDSEARFRSLVEEAPVATGLFVGRDLRIAVANDAILRVWGKGQTVFGKPLAEALPELVGQPFLAILDEVFTSGKAYEARQARAELEVDGVLGTYYFDYTYKPLRNSAGEVYAIMDTAVDVTEAVTSRQTIEAAQQELLRTHQRLNLAMQAAQLGAYTLDLATGQMAVSAQCRANYGQPAQTPFDFADLMRTIIDEDRDRVQQAVQQALETHTIYTAEYQIEWPDRTRHWVRASGQPEYGADGQPVRISGVTQEITAQRLMQQELEEQVQQRTQQLQALVADLRRSNENLEQFAYIASHDLQEPLRKIQQFGDLLQGQYSEALGEGATYLKRMQVAASRMSVLIKDLLAFSRIATMQVITQPVSLSELVNQVLESLSVAIEESGARIEIDPLPTVAGDAQQLSQLFQNLLANALKFRRTDAAGQLLRPQIGIRSRQLAKRDLPPSVKPSREAQAYYLIEVIDNGIGFEEKYVDRIFQVFQRLHGKNEFAGTGVGLAIVQKVVTNHGGAITATSQAGQGATFLIYLPAML